MYGEGKVTCSNSVRITEISNKTLNDFCGRINHQRCNKRVLESLIKCGATASFGESRQSQLDRLDAVLATAQREQRDREAGQVSLFGDLVLGTELAAPLGKVTEAPRRELLGWEKELLGIYLSEHPLQPMAERLGDVVPPVTYLAALKEVDDDLIVVACV